MLGVFGDESRSIAKFDSKVWKIQVQETHSPGIFHAVFTEVQKLNETDLLDYEWVVGLSWLRSENYGKLQGEIRKQYFLTKSTCTLHTAVYKMILPKYFLTYYRVLFN